MINWLQNWYFSNCNGDWEHGIGIRISTIDNPGWSVSINLQDTDLEEKTFETVDIERNDNDWIHCRQNNGFFEGFGGPHNLEEIIRTFKEWAES